MITLPASNVLSYEQQVAILNKALETLQFASPLLNPKVGQAAPGANYLRAGLVAYADGTNWDPAGDGTEGYFWYDGSAWQQLALNSDIPVVPAQKIVQVVNANTGAVATSSTAIPPDDTIPQKTEGSEILTCAITPTSATNHLLINLTLQATCITPGKNILAALFQDDVANALNSTWGFTNSYIAATLSLMHYMTAGTTSETTFKMRAGANDTTTITINGWNGGRLFGGTNISSITIWEIAA